MNEYETNQLHTLEIEEFFDQINRDSQPMSDEDNWSQFLAALRRDRDEIKQLAERLHSGKVPKPKPYRELPLITQEQCQGRSFAGWPFEADEIYSRAVSHHIRQAY